MTPERRALWLQTASRGVLASLGIRYTVKGSPPQSGLVVSNHLSYLDILIYSAVMPCAFVSKREVSNWPYFGAAARAGGSIFLDRTGRAGAALAAAEMASRLHLQVPLLLFPEGTSTDGSCVQHFHSSLFEPAVKAAAPVSAAAVRYVIGGDVAESELCWFGDAPFLPHLWKTLGTPGFSAEIAFAQSRVYTDRRSAAIATREQVAALRGNNQPALNERTAELSR